MKIKDENIRCIIASTIEASYLPIIILDNTSVQLIKRHQGNPNTLLEDSDFKNFSASHQSWVSMSLISSNYLVATEPKYLPIVKSMWKTIKELLFPGNKIRKLRDSVDEFSKTSESEYRKYVSDHEENIQVVQKEIDTINKRKPIMKDYILRKVSEKLRTLGIDSEISDYQMESIDYRIFKLNNEFLEIKNQFDIVKGGKMADIMEKIPMLPPIYMLAPVSFVIEALRKKQLKELESSFSLLKKEIEHIFARMDSDNSKIKDLSLSLKNIADIYSEVNDRFIPSIEKILFKISAEYSSVNQVPDDILFFLQSTTKCLKQLAERRIIPRGDQPCVIQSVVESSNDISVQYYALRDAFAEAV